MEGSPSHLRCPRICGPIGKSSRNYSSITVGDVIDGLKSIKPGKQDGNYGITSDHLINSSNKFKIVLSMVMSSMMVHGYNANDLLSSMVISIPKNTRGDMSQSDNYRGISLCNCICKLFDVILMKKSIKYYTQAINNLLLNSSILLLCVAVC